MCVYVWVCARFLRTGSESSCGVCGGRGGSSCALHCTGIREQDSSCARHRVWGHRPSCRPAGSDPQADRSRQVRITKQARQMESLTVCYKQTKKHTKTIMQVKTVRMVIMIIISCVIFCGEEGFKPCLDSWYWDLVQCPIYWLVYWLLFFLFLVQY